MFPSFLWIRICLTRFLAKKEGGDETNSELKIADVAAISPTCSVYLFVGCIGHVFGTCSIGTLLDSRTRTTTSTRFSHDRATLSARKPASFWREKRDTVVILHLQKILLRCVDFCFYFLFFVILVRGFARMLSCQNKSRPLYCSSFGIFRSVKRLSYQQ